MASSLARMLAVFDAFSAEHPTLTAEDIMARMGYSRGTAYRYVRELVTCGFLARVGGGAYTLGPRIIELDYAIRQCDPVLNASRGAMQALRNKFDCDVLLTSFFDGRVLVIHHEVGGDRITMSFGRGRVMPLFRGAPSKAVLATLPAARLKKLHADNAREITAAGLGASWEEFKAKLGSIRKQGYCVSHGELDPGNVGVAVPLAGESGHGSLALVLSKRRYDIIDKALLVDNLAQAARQIEASTAQPAAAEVVPLRVAAPRKARSKAR